MRDLWKRRYPDLRFARMSDGTWSIIRDLGPVKGGKGLRCHECVFSFRIRIERLKWNIRIPLPAMLVQVSM